MGCAIHETTQQKQDCCQSNNQKITKKPSHLKESHSALVKILESAPIRPTNQIESPKHHHYRKRHSKITDELDRSSEEDESEVVLGTSKCPWKKNRMCREWRNNKVDDNKMDTDEDNSMDDLCRRNSLDSLEGGCHNDSGCDSDCPENITELCKKFDEKNLTEEEDVGLFLLFIYYCSK